MKNYLIFVNLPNFIKIGLVLIIVNIVTISSADEPGMVLILGGKFKSGTTKKKIDLNNSWN